MFIHVKAVEFLLKTRGRLPVNVVCLFEDEEEISSHTLGAFFENYRQLLAASATLVFNMQIQIPASDWPAATYALRVTLGVELEVQAPKRDLHLGVLGGAVSNPHYALGDIFGGLHDGHGQITLRGFCDRVSLVDPGECTYIEISMRFPMEIGRMLNLLSVRSHLHLRGRRLKKVSA